MIPIGIITLDFRDFLKNVPDREHLMTLCVEKRIMIPIGIMRKKSITSVADLGQLIRTERKAQGLTQADLAGASGVSLRFLSELERGRSSAGIGRVLRILHMLGLDVQVDGLSSRSSA